MRVDLGCANHHAALSLARVRFLSPGMKELMRKEGILEDLIQELYAAAWVAYKKEMSVEDTRRYAQRRIYAFLKAYGFRCYRRGYVRTDIAFTVAFKYNINDRGIAPRNLPPPVCFTRDSDHLDEKMLALLKEHPEGLPRSKIAMSFQVPVREVDIYLAPLIRKGIVIEIKRENTRGRPFTPLLVIPSPEKPLPVPDTPARDRDERIRKAYFVQRKSIKQIAREFHHNRRTVRRALGAEAGGR